MIMATNNNTVVYFVDVISINNPAFCSYLICVCLLILKMMVLTLLTIFHRMRSKLFLNEEDAKWKNGEVSTNEIIDRIRRAYQNDMEGIPLFVFVSFGYLFTQPPFWLINTLFIIYLVIRALHTFVYAIYVMPQPTRASLWAVGFILTGYMAVHTALYAFIYGYF